MSRPSLADSAVRLNTRRMNVTVSDGQKRKDAVRNRSAILDAARGLFAESAEVSMCEVARRAGVGQATLYRNFPDRRALAAELLGEHVQRLALLAEQCAGDADAFFVLLRRLVETVVDLYAWASWHGRTRLWARSCTRDREFVAALMRRPTGRREGRPGPASGHVARRRLLGGGHGQRRHGQGKRRHGARRGGQPRALTLALEGLVPPARPTLNAGSCHWAGWSTHLDNHCESC